MEVGGEKRQLVAADNTTSKRRKLNADVLQRLARDLSDEQLEKAVNVLCGDVSLARAAKYVKGLAEFWEEPLSKLPEELFQLILYNAFDTTSQALQLALVCKR